MKTEEGLDTLMEECLKEKRFDVMKKALDRIEPTYSKHKYYLKLYNRYCEAKE